MEGTPSAAVVWTGSSGQGGGADRGAAAVLDTNVERSNNWAVLDSQQIAREAQASKERLAKDAQKRKNEEALNKQMQKMQLEPVFDKTQEHLVGMIQKQNEELAGIAAQEENFLHPTSATQKKISEFSAKNKVLSVLDKDNKDYLDKMLVEVANPDNIGEYDMEHFNKKINEYSELAKSSDDPVKAMSEFRNDPSNNPLRVNASIEDVVEDIPIEYGKDGKVDWDKTENLLTISLENPRKQDKVRSLISQGKSQDTEGVKERAMEYMKLANADKLVKQPSRSNSGGSNNTANMFGSGGSKNFVAGGDSIWDTSNGNLDKITLTMNGGSMKPSPYHDPSTGTSVPIGETVMEVKDGGKWYITGQSFKEVGREWIDSNKATQKADFAKKYGMSDEDVHIEDGHYVLYRTTGRQISVPLEGNEGAVQAATGGWNPYQFIEQWNKANSGKKVKAAAQTKTTQSKVTITFTEWKKNNPNGTFSDYKSASK